MRNGTLNVVITSGGTKVPIDDVRYIMNMSTGRYGANLVKEFVQIPKTFVHHVFAKDSKTLDDVITSNDITDKKYTRRGTFESSMFKDYDQYSKIAPSVSKFADIIISAAAVSDYTMDKTSGKISSNDDEMIIRLKKAKKILPLLREANPNALIVGFKLLVNPTLQEKEDAIEKVFSSGSDYVVYNNLTDIKKGSNTREVYSKEDGKIKLTCIVNNAKALTQFVLDRWIDNNTDEHSTWTYRKRSEHTTK